MDDVNTLEDVQNAFGDMETLIGQAQESIENKDYEEAATKLDDIRNRLDAIEAWNEKQQGE